MILVTGGAGYIGSHVVKALLDLNYNVIVIDNLSAGHLGAVDARAIFVHGDIKDERILDDIFCTYPIKSIMHFAANCYVGESVINPLKYYQNNVAAGISLLSKMLVHKVGQFVFSSSCTVYGIPELEQIDETCRPDPINPYGRSKLIMEQILKDFATSYDFNYICLRYFNAAGADPSGIMGEDHEPETHLIPNILFNLTGKKECITVFGDDYATPDGTCIRDYIHVCDLSNAHILALQSLEAGTGRNEYYNLGNGHGYSVKEVIQMCEKVTGKKAAVCYGARRKGDPPKLISAAQKIYGDLGWKPRYTLQDIIETAWNWHICFPNGYASVLPDPTLE